MFGEAHCNFPRRLAGNLWQEFFQFYPMDERKGLGSTHEKFVKVSVSPSTIFCQIRLTRRWTKPLRGGGERPVPSMRFR